MMQTGESKKCLKAGKVSDLSVPPGFTSRTGFILKRIASDEGTQKIAPLKNLEDSALEANLQIKRRAWIVHDELDNHEKERDDRLSHESAINTCSGKLLKQLICLDKLLLTFAQKAVKSRWDYLFRGVKTPEVIRLKDACGKGSDIAVALKARVKEEARQREFLCTKSQSRKMDKCFDEGERKECCICSSVLYLSAAFCPCNRNRFACLKHTKNLCSCAWSSKVFHFRFSHDQLNLLVEATEGKFSAVHKWVKENMACARENGEPNRNVLVIPDNDSSTEKALEHKGETSFSSANCNDNDDDARRKAELSERMARILGVPSFDCTGSKLFDTFAEIDSSGSSSEFDDERSFLPVELKVKKPLGESHSASNGQASGSLHKGKETKSSGKPEVICLSSSGDDD